MLYAMIREQEATGLPRETILMRWVLYLSRVRRNWIDSEVKRLASERPRRVLGETYEVPKPGGGGFTKIG